MRVTLVLTSSQLHPYCQQKTIVDYCRSRGIIVQAYTPLIRGQFGSPVLQELSKKVSLGFICLYEILMLNVQYFKSMARTPHRSLFVGPSSIGAHLFLVGNHDIYHDEPSFVPLPKSQNPDRVRTNIDVFNFEMSKDDMQRLDELDRGKDGAVTWNPIDVD
jgi:diketogulonate reductase-like aldo/keto reductase